MLRLGRAPPPRPPPPCLAWLCWPHRASPAPPMALSSWARHACSAARVRVHRKGEGPHARPHRAPAQLTHIYTHWPPAPSPPPHTHTYAHPPPHTHTQTYQDFLFCCAPRMWRWEARRTMGAATLPEAGAATARTAAAAARGLGPGRMRTGLRAKWPSARGASRCRGPGRTGRSPTASTTRCVHVCVRVRVRACVCAHVCHAHTSGCAHWPWALALLPRAELLLPLG